MSALRQVLAEVKASAGGGISLAEVARKVGISSEEASSMIDYWARKGRLSVDDIGNACASGGCGSCAHGHNDAPGCGAAAPGKGPVLLAISVRPRDEPPRDVQ